MTNQVNTVPDKNAVIGGKPRLFPSWGLKIAMAVTGLVWAAFVLVHLFGNFKVFVGAEDFNGYAHWLRHALYPLLPSGLLLIIFRIVLSTTLLIHVVSAVILYVRGRRNGTIKGWQSFQSRIMKGGRLQAVSAALMPFTGILILFFIAFHVFDLTVGWEPFASSSFDGGTPQTSEAYHNLVESFKRPLVAYFYSLTMILLSIHVLHGVKTAATDLGAMGYRLRLIATWVAGLAAIAILLGNGMIPIATQLGVLS